MPPTQRQQGEKAADAAEQDANKAARESAEAGGQPADASATAAAAANPDVVVTEGASPKYSTKPGDVPVDPRTGQTFGKVGGDGLKGAYGAELLNATGPVVPGVDPDRIPAEVTPGVSPDAGGDRLLAAAQAKAPSLTREFVTKMKLSDEQLGQIARGEIPPPPTPGPAYTADMYMTPGGFQQTPPGVPPQDVGGNQVHRA
jgi:hypothetical protein